MSNFSSVIAEFPEVLESARRAETLALSDPTGSCFYARRALELAVNWVYANDSSIELPYGNELSSLIHEPTFIAAAGGPVFEKCRVIKDLGNRAVHSPRSVPTSDSIAAVKELFHVCYWLARTYAKGEKPSPDLTFDPKLLPVTTTVTKQTVQHFKALSDQFAAQKEKLFALLAEKESLDAELQKARAEMAAIKLANAASPDTHNYSEAETRRFIIDLYLKEAGWPLDKPEDTEYEVEGMPNNEGKGYVDYVLWGKDGKPLGLVEAKRTTKDPNIGKQQAKLYADCLEAKFGQRPVIFYSNGYDHWIWDSAFYPPRQVQGFYKRDELELLVHRRQARKSLAAAPINQDIVERYYQSRAIRRIGESFEKDHYRKALVVMATGAGKTRTVIALADQLMHAGWVKRVLFLADRTALVNQAVNAFKAHLPSATPVNLVTEKHNDGRVFFSTYQTMIGLIDQQKGSERLFGPGHFDLVVIDEAHRSVYMKYGAIFDYFDSLLVGLTATPKDEVDKNTYRLFDLEEGVPTDVYSLEDAVKDGFLVPPKAVSVPLKLLTEGLVYDQLSEAEKEQFDLTDWKERSDQVKETGRVEAAAVNKWLFNIDTVDKVLKHLMEKGVKVEDGDKLGKTIIFAKNHDHAQFICDRFNKNYPESAGQFAQVIDYSVNYVQSLIDDFSDTSKLPQIAISVDMLDTGIDVPDVVNLVFFKQVRSKTKFWQMVGRGTRLRPNLFGWKKDKEFFNIFDYCGNLEFFSQNLPTTDGSSGMSLSQKLFVSRIGLIDALNTELARTGLAAEQSVQYGAEPQSDWHVHQSLVDQLQKEVGSMNLDNFIVRGKRALVEKYQSSEVWGSLDEEKLGELVRELSNLPSDRKPEPLESKQFDLLILRLQLSLLNGGKGFKTLKAKLIEAASILEESSTIPAISKHLALIQEIQTEQWWEGVTLPMLEVVRLRLRDTVTLITGRKGSPVFTDFIDEMGVENVIDLPGVSSDESFERFKEKARVFLRSHLDKTAIQKIRMNEPLSSQDLAELEGILASSGVGSEEQVKMASQEGLAFFVRSLVGLDRAAAKQALGEFVHDRKLSAAQIEFLDMITNYLTEHGVMEPAALYESPFTDVSPTGPEKILDESLLTNVIEFLRFVKQRVSVI